MRGALWIAPLLGLGGCGLTCTLNEAGDAVERIALSEYSPPTFTIQIEGDDGPVAEDTFTPDYEVDEPNGPGCGERHRATVTMSF